MQVTYLKHAKQQSICLGLAISILNVKFIFCKIAPMQKSLWNRDLHSLTLKLLQLQTDATIRIAKRLDIIFIYVQLELYLLYNDLDCE